MGKPFADELEALKDTYEWCTEVDNHDLEGLIRSCRTKPLYSVGSGGSLTSAHFHSLLHQQSGTIARASTPLEVCFAPHALRDTCVFFLTAAGGNPDILASFKQVALNEPRTLGAICMRTGSMLKSISEHFWSSRLIEYDLPSGKDGFLATNSLLALMVLLARAYDSSNHFSQLPSLSHVDTRVQALEQIFYSSKVNDTWLVLYGGWCMPVAMDIESKLSEAALGHAHPADYRNFAHGRHHWLAKRGNDTSIIALSTPEEKQICDRTLALLPQDIPVIRLQTECSGPKGTIDLFVLMLKLINMLGSRLGIDPGRPGVPEFGRKIYNLSYTHKSVRVSGLGLNEEVSITRKLYPRLISDISADELNVWRKSYEVFYKHLTQRKFDAVVFDYDGTLCYTSERFDPLRPAILSELTRILSRGILIGIATGRGKSVRKELIALPSSLHKNVYVGYHNGGEIYSLEEEAPLSTGIVCSEMREIEDAIDMDEHLKTIFRKSVAHKQITFEAEANCSSSAIVQMLLPHVRRHGNGCQLVASSHSVDILAPGVSKLSIVEFLSSKISDKSSVICIGDKGRWPGNDHLLLEEPYSLSVDEVSASQATCWNIAPAGHIGVQATVGYLHKLFPSSYKAIVSKD